MQRLTRPEWDSTSTRSFPRTRRDTSCEGAGETAPSRLWDSEERGRGQSGLAPSLIGRVSCAGPCACRFLPEARNIDDTARADLDDGRPSCVLPAMDVLGSTRWGGVCQPDLRARWRACCTAGRLRSPSAPSSLPVRHGRPGGGANQDIRSMPAIPATRSGREGREVAWRRTAAGDQRARSTASEASVSAKPTGIR